MKKRWIAALLALGLAAGIGGTLLVRETKGPRAEAFTAVRRPLVQTLVASGRIEQRRQSELGAMVQSTVAEVPVDEGDRVEQAALLVRLADDEALAQRAAAEAAVAEAEARLQRVTGIGRRLATEQLRQARTDAEQAETEYQRQRQLHERGAASEATLERARQSRDATRSRRVAATLELAATRTDGAEAQAAAAALARAQAELRAAQVAIERTQIRAPSAGVVLRRLVEPGEVVRPGEPLLVFAGEGPLEVVVRPDESNLAQLERGQRARVSPEAFPEVRLEARVTRIAPSVDAQRGTVEVALALGTEDAEANATTVESAPAGESATLRPDMTVSVEIVTGQAEEALVLPTALVRDAAGEQPWVLVVEEGVARRRDVRLGLRGDDVVEIREGLDGETPVLGPEVDRVPGEPVRLRATRPGLDGEGNGAVGAAEAGELTGEIPLGD
ncbi:MAG TPA: efflux RND transporter periplasmic adaptor subunit [Polyangiaceae bacterium LLY-WYZ-15_(1-7)]|nr:efflux transporter periplasmic adaptor subunit [Myxococcales bacterium]MAT26970.1 efflux transporter periplasmic adaptor subunit [Sandaracinus sp.]MBJ71729.1 efflux transporter periplasmic adaptor subunit [Sandaracinus sp.]HJL03709.1 efflux RND transporter periplasmic adaptor subunit [Polyangiaceae bacterium LLY-WYZ-15_(1-7)]HJL10922.1 efflux RND transporter periplasmic adaptor subunit [Polyangiaceae bacterium LLY-WYZ-15_(1-7)]